MKKLIIVLLLALAINCKVDAQAPQGFNFQGIALDSTGYVVTSKLVSLRFSISTDSLGNSVSYRESTSSQTDKYGQFTTVIGSGVPSIGRFNSIIWSSGNLYMKTEIDISNTGKYVVTGLSRLLSVPYALQANLAGNIASDNYGNTKAGSSALDNNKVSSTNGTVAIGDSALKYNYGIENTAIGSKSMQSKSISSGGSNTAIGNSSLFSISQGNGNTASGVSSLYSNTDGSANTSSGYQSMYSNTLGFSNTAMGTKSLYASTTGSRNTALGDSSMLKNTTGSFNTATGYLSLSSNTTGEFNSAYGSYSMEKNTTGNENIAFGGEAFRNNTTGRFNVAVGAGTLGSNTTGDENTAIGRRAMNDNLTGTFNTAIGQAALYANKTGSNNTAMGRTSLVYNTVGEFNTAIGATSITNNTTGSNNTGIGNNVLGANTTGSKNTAIGYNAGAKSTSGDKNIFIGYEAGNNKTFSSASNKLVIQNDSSLNPLIYGEFDTKKLTVNGKLIVGDPSILSSSAILEASSTTQGFLPPRLTYAQKMAIINPATGLVVFCTDCGPPSIGGELEVFSGGIWRNMNGASALGVAASLPSATIGSQVWTNKNLDVSTYRNGDIIPQVTDATAWAALTTGAWCYYNNDSTLGAKYGKLYNWYAVNDPRGLAPSGYHIPSDAEWTTLGTYLGGESVAGAKMKETGTLNWLSPNISATNLSGFSGLPGGTRDNSGKFLDGGKDGYWWSAAVYSPTNSWHRSLSNYYGNLGRHNHLQRDAFSVRCLRDSTALGLPPTVSSTTAATSITTTTATSGGNITSDGGSAITARGVCWSTSQNPTTADSKTTDGGTTGTFTSSLTGLVGATIYYLRSYATNGLGTEYGNQVSFTTTAFVTIGSQVWTNKNLDVSTYRNGDIIPQVTDATAWAALTTGAWCYYNNDSTLGAKYGKLYNWYAVNDPRGLAPSGYHIPSDAEWTTLGTYLGGESVAGAKMKETGTLNWLSPNISATNLSGFSGLPGGTRDNSGKFLDGGKDGYWWSAAVYSPTDSWHRSLSNYYGNLGRHNHLQRDAFSVRCLRD